MNLTTDLTGGGLPIVAALSPSTADHRKEPPMTRPFHVRLAEVLRWARANDWRPKYPTARRLGQYSWTNLVPDPGNRKQSTLKVIVDISGHVEVHQRMTNGWVCIGNFRSGSGRGVIDILAAMCVVPKQLSTAYAEGRRDEARAANCREAA